MRKPPSACGLTLLALCFGLSASAAEPARSPAPAATAKPAAAAGAYSGHGSGSVPPELLAKFAPPPLPSEITRPLQAALDIRAPGSGQVSPDGKRLYFSWNVTGLNQLWRIDGPQRFPQQLTGGEDETRLVDISPDGHWLLLERDRNGEEYPGLYLQPADGGALQPIQHLPRVQTFGEYISDDNRYVYFRANDVKPDSFVIYRWDRTTGKRELVFDQEGRWEVRDFRADGRLLLLKDLGSAVSEIYEWNPATQTLKPIIGQGEREEFNATYGAADGDVLVLTPKLGEFRRLYRWRAGQLTPITPDLAHDVSSFAIDRSHSRIAYTVNQDGYTLSHAIDARTFKPLAMPKLPEADHVEAHTFSRDGRFMTITVETSVAPRLSYVLDWKSGKLTQWQLPSAPEVDLSHYVRAKLESYPARDGTKIPMFVRRPPHCTEPCPVVVQFHGGPEGQARPGFDVGGQFLVDAGFVVVQPNVRGSDGYGKSWFHADDGAKRLLVITDIEDCARFIRKEWAVNGQAPRIGIAGGSYGGYSTLVGMTMFAGAYDAGVDIVGFSNLVTFLNNTAPYRRANRIREYGDPDKDHDALVKLSPVTYIDRVKAPLLIIQGANDPRVPAGEAIQMHKALEARGIASPLILFPDEGHGAHKRGNIVLQTGHMIRFLKEKLQPKP